MKPAFKAAFCDPIEENKLEARLSPRNSSIEVLALSISAAIPVQINFGLPFFCQKFEVENITSASVISIDCQTSSWQVVIHMMKVEDI